MGLGLSCGEQNLLLCETAQAAKSCLPPARCLMSHMALAEAGARQCTVAQEPPALARTPAYPGGNPLRRLMGLLLLC